MTEYEHEKVPSKVGTEAWFRQEAWKSLQRAPDGSWDFSDSSLMYSPASTQAYREAQEEDTAYAREVTAVEHGVFRDVAKDIAVALPQQFSYIDLGPGTEHKERYLFDAVHAEGKHFEYYPIDISSDVLAESRRFAAEQNVVIHPMNGRFEDVAREIEQSVPEPRFVSLGATFANYEPSVIIPMTLQLAGKDGSVMITAQLRERIDINEVRKAYESPQTIKMYEGKLSLLGIQPDDIERFEVSDDLIVRAQIKTPPQRLATMGMEPGDWVTILKTYRWSRGQLEDALRDTDFVIHDTGATFVVVHYKSRP